ncbi:homeodomain transcription factor ste12 [Gryganskiella cystojenkinii]|nr:homeodomain transcription factor ste12 [Gryganskiella cystojenkinii]
MLTATSRRQDLFNQQPQHPPHQHTYQHSQSSYTHQPPVAHSQYVPPLQHMNHFQQQSLQQQQNSVQKQEEQDQQQHHLQMHQMQQQQQQQQQQHHHQQQQQLQQHQQHQQQQQQQQHHQQLQHQQQLQQQQHQQHDPQQHNLLHDTLSLTTASATRIEEIDRLSVFLTTAPTYELELSRFQLPTGETISCVLWNELYHITGTDIVRSLVSRFESFGRPVRNIKKFEEGVFSDLRNLKPGADACLEEPKSPFLEMLYRNNCIRTQKKQKVFYWYSVPHDRLFLDAMERDLKREQSGAEPTSQAVSEPALSCTLETVRDLVERLSRRTIEMNTITETLQSFTPDGVAPLNRQLQANVTPSATSPTQAQLVPDGGSLSSMGMGGLVASRSESISGPFSDGQGQSQKESSYLDDQGSDDNSESKVPSDVDGYHNTEGSLNHEKTGVFGSFTVFEGSPTYKKRRRRSTANPSNLSDAVEHVNNGLHGANPLERRDSLDLEDGAERYLEGGLMSSTSLDSLNGIKQEHARPLHHQGSASMSSLQSLQTSSGNPSRSYACPVPQCGRLFKRLEHLKRHWRTHTLERPYACTICAKRFSRSDNLAAHRKTHDKPSWGNDEDGEGGESGPSGLKREGDLDDEYDDEQDEMPLRISKGYASDQSLGRKRRRYRDGMESMSERESLSGFSSGDDEDEEGGLSGLQYQQQQQQQHHHQQQQAQQQQFQMHNRYPMTKGPAGAMQPMMPQQYPPHLQQQRSNIYPEMALGPQPSFMSAMSMMPGGAPPQAAYGGPYQPVPLSAGFSSILAQQPIPPPLFTVEEEDDENEEITDMEKLRYKYEYEIKAAIDSTPVLSEVTRMITPYNAGAFGYGGAMAEYVPYGPYPLSTPVALGSNVAVNGRYAPFEPSVMNNVGGNPTVGVSTASAPLFSTAAMVPTSSSSSSSSSVSISTANGGQPSSYPVVHTTALPPSHHHQEYLELAFGTTMLPTNVPI